MQAKYIRTNQLLDFFAQRTRKDRKSFCQERVLSTTQRLAGCFRASRGGGGRSEAYSRLRICGLNFRWLSFFRNGLETVAYCESLLKKFQGRNVLPLICPMVPFLDPGSRFFEEPHKNGYRIFHRTLEEHRQALLEPLWFKHLNYETRWMSRRELHNVTYESMARLVSIKEKLGIMPLSFCEAILSTIEETKSLLAQTERALELDGRLPPDLRDTIRIYNRKILAYSSDQIIPIPRPFGGRWFDDFTIPSTMIKELTG